MNPMENTQFLEIHQELSDEITILKELFSDKKQNHLEAYNEAIDLINKTKEYCKDDNLSIQARVSFYKSLEELIDILLGFKLSDKIELLKETMLFRILFIKNIQKESLEEKITLTDFLINCKKDFSTLLNLMKKEKDLELSAWLINYLESSMDMGLSKIEIKEFAFKNNLKYLIIGNTKIKAT